MEEAAEGTAAAAAAGTATELKDRFAENEGSEELESSTTTNDYFV